MIKRILAVLALMVAGLFAAHPASAHASGACSVSGTAPHAVVSASGLQPNGDYRVTAVQSGNNLNPGYAVHADATGSFVKDLDDVTTWSAVPGPIKVNIKADGAYTSGSAHCSGTIT